MDEKVFIDRLNWYGYKMKKWVCYVVGLMLIYSEIKS